ncbi:UNVERIFIED_CONTAM: hypothetical protein PYX00_001461 [Menopon gallinae]|uniref:Uncharacterized protein n=1 Tax=Menopon gallinae TaxID=328185 RepID=A0AAW2IDZ8_9NEOP
MRTGRGRILCGPTYPKEDERVAGAVEVTLDWYNVRRIVPADDEGVLGLQNSSTDRTEQCKSSSVGENNRLIRGPRNNEPFIQSRFTIHILIISLRKIKHQFNYRNLPDMDESGHAITICAHGTRKWMPEKQPVRGKR